MPKERLFLTRIEYEGIKKAPHPPPRGTRKIIVNSYCKDVDLARLLQDFWNNRQFFPLDGQGGGSVTSVRIA
jgi:hypothetical protein